MFVSVRDLYIYTHLYILYIHIYINNVFPSLRRSSVRNFPRRALALALESSKSFSCLRVYVIRSCVNMYIHTSMYIKARQGYVHFK